MEERDTASLIDAARTTRPSFSNTNSFQNMKRLENGTKLGQFLFGLVYWALMVSAKKKYTSPSYDFIMCIALMSWLSTIFFLSMLIIGNRLLTNIALSWQAVECGFNSLWSLLYFIAANVQVAHNCPQAQHSGHLVAASVFAYITTFCYITHAIASYHSWKSDTQEQPVLPRIHTSAPIENESPPPYSQI